MKKLDVFVCHPSGQSYELISGYIAEEHIPGMVVAFDRLRPFLPLSIYFDSRRCVGYDVTAAGQFRLKMKAVANG